MRPAVPLLAALAAGAPWLASQGLRGDGGIVLEVEQGAEGLLVTPRAESAPLDRVCEDLASELGCTLEGQGLVDGSLLVTADLERRPVELVLEYVLGSVGLSYRLRTGTLSIVPDPVAAMPAHNRAIVVCSPVRVEPTARPISFTSFTSAA